MPSSCLMVLRELGSGLKISDGNVADFGVWRGGCSSSSILSLSRLGVQVPVIYLCLVWVFKFQYSISDSSGCSRHLHSVSLFVPKSPSVSSFPLQHLL